MDPDPEVETDPDRDAETDPDPDSSLDQAREQLFSHQCLDPRIDVTHPFVVHNQRKDHFFSFKIVYGGTAA